MRLSNYAVSAEHERLDSLVKLLQLRAALQGDKTAYIFLVDGEQQTQSLTYAELDKQARTIAISLQAKDLQGERAVLLYPQGLDYIAAFFGCLYAGVIAVPAYPPKNQRHLPRLQAIIDDSQAAIILSTQAVTNSARTLYREQGGRLAWLLTDQTLANDVTPWQMPEITPESLAFLQYTSGSTGHAKGVMVSHGNLMANQEMIKTSFGHNSLSTVVGWLPMYHDMGLIGNVMQPLYIGAPVILMSPMTFLEKPLRWLQAISHYRAHTSGAPNFAFDLCVQKISTEEKSQLDLSSWQLAFNGSEPVHAATLERFATAFAECGFRKEAFYPCYGLAEATLLVTGGHKTVAPTIKAFNKTKLEQHVACSHVAHLPDYRRLVSCGNVVINQQIRIVNPENQTLCPEGQIGEIQVSGANVAQGYWQNQQATNATFITDEQQKTWLRTGDLGFIDQGELFISGRLKDLIIIRGRNYYPHDIEHAVQQSVACLSVNGVASFIIDSNDSEKLILLAELKRNALRQANYHAEFTAMRRCLVEECGIQADSIVLLKPNAILKTTSGKIRRSACRELYLQQQLEIVAIDDLFTDTTKSPSKTATISNLSIELDLLRKTLLTTDIKKATPLLAHYLRGHIATLSGIAQTQIDLSTSVLSLGIDSLKAIELKYVIDGFLHIDFPLMRLLDDYSLVAIAEYALELASHTEKNDVIANNSNINPLDIPLSFGQQALWTHCQVTATPTLYNMSVALQIHSELNQQALQSALQIMFNRHAQLRANFVLNENKQPRQMLATQIMPAFIQVHCDDELDRQQKLAIHLNQTFDLARDVLLRTWLFSTASDNHILVFCAHHLIIDLRSMTLLLAELKQLYQTKTCSLPVLTASYSDYINWQQQYLHSAEADTAWQYWQQQLAGEIPKLNLPVRKNNATTACYQGKSENLVIDLHILKKLHALANTHQVTLYTLLLTLFKTLLYRYTRQHDVIVGSPALGRSKQDFAKLVGYFVNPVALRSKPIGHKSFIDYLLEVKQTVLAALQHQDYPFLRLVEKLQPTRGAGISPFYQTFFVLQGDSQNSSDAILALAVSDMTLNWSDLNVKTYQLPEIMAQFDLTLMMAETEQGLLASFQYRQDLFDRQTILYLMAHFQCLINGVLANPNQCLSQLPLLTVDEIQQQVYTWNKTQKTYPQVIAIHQLVEQQAEKTPDAIAVSFQNQHLSYAELNSRANQLARYLQMYDVQIEARVAVCMERSVELIISLLAILKAGASYLPIDPAYPLERQRYILQNANAQLVLTHSSLLNKIEQPPAITIVCVDNDELYQSYSVRNLPIRVATDNTAYIIYTSGSTGKPKGVMVSHANVVHSTLARQQYYVEPVGCYLLLSSFAFDSSVAGIFWTLSQGGCLCLPNEQQPKDPMSLGKLIEQQQVTHLLALPALYSALLETVASHRLASLNTVIVAGEACSSKVAQQHHQHLAHAALYNEYGPTEATVWSTVHPVVHSTEQNIPIGKPISNTQIYLLDNYLQIVPVGIVGEIYIGGAGITRGYLQQPALTAERFIPNPFSDHGERLYKTGDLAYYQTDGSIQFCGRCDHQVKLRGYRIECGEIEARLLENPAVKDAIVLICDNRLVAYIVERQNGMLEANKLKAQLQNSLPDYMIPSAWLFLNAFPLNANGKVDRAALLALEHQIAPQTELVAPRDEVEEAIAEIWREILGVEALGIHDDFFELGGHSLAGVQVMARVQELFAIDVPVNVIFEAPTIAEFVDKVAEYQN